MTTHLTPTSPNLPATTAALRDLVPDWLGNTDVTAALAQKYSPPLIQVSLIMSSYFDLQPPHTALHPFPTPKNGRRPTHTTARNRPEICTQPEQMYLFGLRYIWV